MVDLMELVGNPELVQPTNYTRKLTLHGKTEPHYVYRIKLDLLYYNDKNDRIATWINKYESEHGPLKREDDMEGYNSIIQEFIKESNPEAMEATLENIKLFSQREPGVVLQDGRVIDGNRRFTCLRELSKESPNFDYFEAVILEGDYSPTDKEIKRLELNIQLGSEKPVDYDPIERMYAVYRDLVKNQTFTKKEYCEAANLKPAELDRLIEKSKLMVKFLEFIGNPEAYYVARELKLDGPLQEAVGVLKKCSDEDSKERMTNIIFTHLLAQSSSDPSRFIRKFKKVAGTDTMEEFLDTQEELAIQVMDEYNSEPEPESDKESNDDVSAVTEPNLVSTVVGTSTQGQSMDASTSNTVKKIKKIRSNTDLKDDLSRQAFRVIDKVEHASVRDAPYKFAQKSKESLDDVDVEMIKNMDVTTQEALSKLLDSIEVRINEIRRFL